MKERRARNIYEVPSSETVKNVETLCRMQLKATYKTTRETYKKYRKMRNENTCSRVTKLTIHLCIKKED